MAPMSRSEQRELDELLSDIYRGIETLPDGSQNVSQRSYDIFKQNQDSTGNRLIGRAQVREYELAGSAPLVRQHRRDLRNDLRAAYNATPDQPQRSTLKRRPAQVGGGGGQVGGSPEPPQSLAAFITTGGGGGANSTTPEARRRVRIVEHPDRAAKSEANTRVKYVNTNKLIYHDEDNNSNDQSDSDNERRLEPAGSSDEEEELLDGRTRVEYYHTSWLDRQLGRASRRRSSKELNERQAKEKAMIEELKRSLKNGAITLRQSFRGNKRSKQQQQQQANRNDPRDEQPASELAWPHRKPTTERRVISSGLATAPRGYSSSHKHKRKDFWSTLGHNNPSSRDHWAVESPTKAAAAAETLEPFSSAWQPVDGSEPLEHPQQQRQPDRKSHNPAPERNATSQSRASEPRPESRQHQLLQAHYRGHQQARTEPPPVAASPAGQSLSLSRSRSLNRDRMRYPGQRFEDEACRRAPGAKSPAAGQQQEPPPLGNTISSLPSATEVVRSALSRSGSQVSLSQLNKTINLLPSSPPPYGGRAGSSAPQTPTQQLKPASPSLSPSPIRSPATCGPEHYSSRTLGQLAPPPVQHPAGTAVLHGTRTVGRPPQTLHDQRQLAQQPQPPVYANPHASLMQHRAEQQLRQPNRNAASVRQFSELDSLLRSLGPSGAAHSTHITAGHSSRPSQGPVGGYLPAGYAPPSQQQPVQPALQPQQPPRTDLYARVQRPPVGPGQPQPQPQQQQPQLQPQMQQQQQSSYSIDVTESKLDENCLQRQQLNEFEAPIEILPSMEDYQNIAKLNPVKNQYWYKPNMSRERAVELLRDKPQGTFIVRDSTSFRGAYGLAVKVAKLPKSVLDSAHLRNFNGDPSSELIRHFLIEPAGSGCRLRGYANEPIFDSLPSLIYQHSLTELALPCKLIIPRADIEDPKFKQKQKQFFDDFLASKEQAKHQPYERNSPDGGYRKYPGDVYVHNEHRIIFE